MLSENEAVEIMAPAIMHVEIETAMSDEELSQHEARAAYRALLPHLSYTSAEKARVDGLVKLAEWVATDRNESAYRRRYAHDALAAFEVKA